MSQDYYSILGIERNSAPEAIKKAYFKLVREFPPDQNPEKFKTVRKAYEILADPVARKDYDIDSKLGDKLAELFEKADNEMDDERWEAAIKYYNTILSMSPNSLGALNSKGLCSLHLQRWNDAIDTFRVLVEKSKNSSIYLKNYGSAYLEKALNKKDSIKKKASNLEKAREIFTKVLEFEPFNTGIYILISNTYEIQKDYTGAIDFLFKIVKTEGELHPPDLDVYAQLIHLYIISENQKALDVTLKNIKKLLKDKMLKEYLIFQLLNKIEPDEDKKFNIHYSQAALKINPRHSLIKKMVGMLEAKEELKTTLQKLMSDTDIVHPVKQMCKSLAEEILYDTDTEEAFMDRVFKSMAEIPPKKVKNSIIIIKSKYPIIYEIEPELFDKILYGI
ncbi:MAG: DnaJ domain-containing protein [Leptospiraceae bacterium]|nr:DnaJ domain-containing protein [Leptospiraceae bacterium]